jgi:hypothetical protein
VSSVPADPDGKQQPVVETLNIGDLGTSVLLDAQVRTDFRAQVALEALVDPFQRSGCEDEPHRGPRRPLGRQSLGQ